MNLRYYHLSFGCRRGPPKKVLDLGEGDHNFFVALEK